MILPRAAALALVVLGASAGCGDKSPTQDAALEPSPSATPTDAASSAPVRATIIDDNYDRARELARRDGKLLFVDLWAPWCAPCLSLRADTLHELAGSAAAASLVFAAVDIDRSENARVLERYRARILPTLMVVRASDEVVLASRTGDLSRTELEAWLAEVEGGTKANDEIRNRLVAAHGAAREGRTREAADTFREAARGARDEVLVEATLGALDALTTLDEGVECARFARSSLPGMKQPGGVIATALALVRCAEALPVGERPEARQAALVALTPLTEPAAAGAPAHLLSDGLALLAELHRGANDGAKAAAVDNKRLSILEAASERALTSEHAQTFDHARVKLYLQLGRSEEAVALLRARAKERSESYETHGRLGTTLLELRRYEEAATELERAVELAYGPPRLVYMGRLAAALQQRPDGDARALRLLEAEVAGWQSLPPSQKDPQRERDARGRLEAAKARAR